MPNYYTTSTGARVTQRDINRHLSATYKGMMVKYCCEACGTTNEIATHDHTISQKRCKELHKTELIWEEKNIKFSCIPCHNEWESYKSGEFTHHRNVEDRMSYTLTHDEQGFMARIDHITNEEIKERLNNKLWIKKQNTTHQMKPFACMDGSAKGHTETSYTTKLERTTLTR